MKSHSAQDLKKISAFEATTRLVWRAYHVDRVDLDGLFLAGLGSRGKLRRIVERAPPLNRGETLEAGLCHLSRYGSPPTETDFDPWFDGSTPSETTLHRFAYGWQPVDGVDFRRLNPDPCRVIALFGSWSSYLGVLDSLAQAVGATYLPRPATTRGRDFERHVRVLCDGRGVPGRVVASAFGIDLAVIAYAMTVGANYHRHPVRDTGPVRCVGVDLEAEARERCIYAACVFKERWRCLPRVRDLRPPSARESCSPLERFMFEQGFGLSADSTHIIPWPTEAEILSLFGTWDDYVSKMTARVAANARLTRTGLSDEAVARLEGGAPTSADFLQAGHVLLLRGGTLPPGMPAVQAGSPGGGDPLRWLDALGDDLGTTGCVWNDLTEFSRDARRTLPAPLPVPSNVWRGYESPGEWEYAQRLRPGRPRRTAERSNTRGGELNVIFLEAIGVMPSEESGSDQRQSPSTL